MTWPFTRALPEIGTEETDTLDFKAEVKRLEGKPSADRFELAKDVASFANASGGTVLIGACGGSRLTAFKAMTADDAEWLAREYEEAVRDRCAPPVSVRAEKLAHGDGAVLAVHVPPFPFQVAVKVRGDAKDGYGHDAWVFFSRVASQNKEFRPEVLPMLTPEMRRIAVLLRSIPVDSKVTVIQRTHGDGFHPQSNCRLVGVDETRNSVVFHRYNGSVASEIRVPLDSVRTAYEERDDQWTVEVAYFFKSRDAR